MKEVIMKVPSFSADYPKAPIYVADLVRCKECKYGEYRDDFNDYECHSSGCGLVYDADFYCADGEREGE